MEVGKKCWIPTRTVNTAVSCVLGKKMWRLLVERITVMWPELRIGITRVMDYS